MLFLITKDVGETTTGHLWMTIAWMYVGFYQLLEVTSKFIVHKIKYWNSLLHQFDFIALLTTIIYITLKLTVPNYFVVLIEDSEVQNRSVGHNIAVFIIHTIQVAKVILTANRIQAFRVLLQALVKTVSRSLISVSVLLLVAMFIFVIFALNIFRESESPNWSNFGNGLLTLFTFVTIDGFYDIQKGMDDMIGKTSRFFTIFFILIGHFLLFNIFIGVNILTIQESNRNYNEKVLAEREANLAYQKQIILIRQEEDMAKFIKEAHDHHYNNVKEIVDNIDRQNKKRIVLKNNLFTDIEWIESYLEMIEETDKTIEMVESYHTEIASKIADYHEHDTKRKIW